MAHPCGNENRADKVMKDRVGKITKGYATGGGVHSDEAEDISLIRKKVKKSALRADGGSVKARADKVSRAKGGRVHKGGKGNHVNVIVAPSPKPPMMPPAPPMTAGPPPMPPKPPMMAGSPSGPPMGGVGGMPPMPPRSDGGRAYKKGGRVKEKMSGEKKHGKHEKPYKMRADGGDVTWEDGSGRSMLEDRKYAGMRHQTGNYTGPSRRARGGKVDASVGGTEVQHSGNKSDTQNIGRGKPITYATGGPVYSDGKKGKQMSWNKASMGIGGGGGGKERMAAAKRLNSKGHEPWTKDALG